VRMITVPAIASKAPKTLCPRPMSTEVHSLVERSGNLAKIVSQRTVRKPRSLLPRLTAAAGSDGIRACRSLHYR
jgi:hypothetical protein